MRRTTILALFLSTTLVLGAAGLAAADEGGKDKHEGRDGPGDGPRDGHGRDHEGFDHQGNRWILHNDVLAVWFHGGENAKPDLRVVLNGTNDEKSGYRVQVLRLCEVTNDSTDCTRALPRLNLVEADDWNVATQQTNDSLTLTMVHSSYQGIVTLVFHVNTTSAVVKFDVHVQNWRWANASDRLVLDTHVIGRNLHNSTGANVSLEDSGYISWAPTASAKYANGTGTLHVSAVQQSERRDDNESDHQEADESQHEKDERASGHGGHLLLVFDGPGNYTSMSYDPELGIASASAKSVPAAPLVLTIAVVALAAVVLSARRK